MTQYRLIIASDPDDLARQCAERIASCIDLALAERDRAQIALAGGETPKPAYERLGREHLPWERVDVLLGDERWVDPEDPASNARMLRETLLAQPPALNARFHPVPTDAESPAADAARTSCTSRVRRACLPVFMPALLFAAVVLKADFGLGGGAGTIKQAQLAAIRHNREVVARYRARAKTPGSHAASCCSCLYALT